MVRHRSGFTAQAPRGFRLSFRRGLYTIRNGRAQLTLFKVGNTTDPVAVAQDLLRDDLRAGRLPNARNRDRFSVGLTSKGRRVELHFIRTGSGVVVAGLAPQLRRVGGTLRGPKRLTGAQLRTLARIARSARNIQARRLAGRISVQRGPTLPLESFTAPDGSLTAQVPRGWQVVGSAGQLTGTDPQGRGSFVFGLPAFVFTPGTIGALTAPATAPRATFNGPRAAMTEVLPALFSTPQNQLGNVQVTQALNEDATQGTYVATFTANGTPFQGLFYVFVQPPGPAFALGSWFIYVSAATVRVGAGAQVANSVLRAWETWDPSANQAQRRQQTIRSIIEAQVTTTNAILSATEFRQAAFARANLQWSSYIRGTSGGSLLPFTQQETGLRVQPASNRVVIIGA